eukprot:NODE_435_length_1381_cov_286.941441_g318_i0.p1 GENE.NODE_435_length_1381_cov_286.941441_g318_i0~~NODE_435_length_1381_cov_286.941441_g318_i0.p1  ORF type:complete len:425 (+),score=109.68 NODE_435_length_1381_cov_286.941441_g318_i0:48-1322(+)
MVNMLMLKAACYRRRLSHTSAAESYKQALQLNPYCFEALSGLFEVLPDAANHLQTIKRCYNQPNHEWLRKWLDLLKAKAAANYPEVLAATQHMTAGVLLGGYNTSVMLEAAEAHYRMAAFTEAANCFERILDQDPHNVDRMDIYASVLQQSGGAKELNSLAHSLITSQAQAPEAWVTLAVLAQKTGGTSVIPSAIAVGPEAALKFVTKATDLDPCHVRAHLMKGAILQAENLHPQAIKAYRVAYQASRDLKVQAGLVESYLLNKQVTDAKLVASSCLAAFPDNALALTLMGDVYYHTNTPAKARKAYEKALAHQPDSQEANLAMANLDCAEGHLAEAISRLRRMVHKNKHLHVRLADVYAQKQEYSDATFHYNAALNYNAEDAAAIAGLKRVDRLVNGIEPDDEDDMDGDPSDENFAEEVVLDS